MVCVCISYKKQSKLYYSVGIELVVVVGQMHFKLLTGWTF